MKVILNVLCEGQTEERFVNKVLKSYLKEFGIVVKAQILVTNKKKSCKGGMLSYDQVKRDLSTWMKEWVEKLEKIALSPQNNRTSVISCL